MKLPSILALLAAASLAACGGDSGGTKADSYESLIRQAEAARQGGDLDGAMPLFGRAAEMNPDGVEAKIGLGQIYLAIGASDEAAAQFRDVLARRSSNPASRACRRADLDGTAGACREAGRRALAG